MQKDYIYEFFSSINRIIKDLEKYIPEDNILYTEKNLNDLEVLVRKFRKKIKVGFRELVLAKKIKAELESDEL